MPIYEYKCNECGEALEARQKFSDDPLVDCPNCGAPALERLVSASSFSLKGSGWYADGYGAKKPEASAEKSPAKPEANGKDTGTKESTASSSDKKSDVDTKKKSSDAKTNLKQAS